MTNEYRIGDCLTVLRTLPDGFAHTCVTSPPYWGLRDYGTASWSGGSIFCDHLRAATGGNAAQGANKGNNNRKGAPFGATCGKCGAVREDQQIGLEETPDAYVERMVAVFREVRRVLRDDGTLWLNLGDSYAGGSSSGAVNNEASTLGGGKATQAAAASVVHARTHGLKPKDLVGIPWRVAFALQADGWWLRSDIIWHKPNPMPESVTDRPTKAHEYVFLMSKSPRYYYDADAIKEQSVIGAHVRSRASNFKKAGSQADSFGRYNRVAETIVCDGSRNKRSVWTVATRPFSGAHFACYPPELIKPCIAAGCPETTCAICGAPWERIVRVDRPESMGRGRGASPSCARAIGAPQQDTNGQRTAKTRRETLGWEPTCEHNERGQGGIVLDPFFGSGTTGMVAESLGRRWFGIELNPEYEPLIRQRTAQRGLL